MHKDRHFSLATTVRWFRSIGVVKVGGSTDPRLRFVREVVEGRPGDSIHLALGLSFLRRKDGEILPGTFRASLDPDRRVVRDAQALLEAMSGNGNAREIVPPGFQHDVGAFSAKIGKVMSVTFGEGETLVRGSPGTGFGEVVAAIASSVVDHEIEVSESFEEPGVRLSVETRDGTRSTIVLCPLRKAALAGGVVVDRFDPEDRGSVRAVIERGLAPALEDTLAFAP